MPALCPTCRHPREVGYGIDCIKGDQIIFDKHEDDRPHYRNRCGQYQREVATGLTQGMIDGVLNTVLRHQAALPEGGN